MNHLSEIELVDSCRLGQRAAQAELYRRYADAMFATCVRMCHTREDAEDVLQRAFTQVFTKFDLFRGESTVGAWIKRIVINQCLNQVQRGRSTLIELEDKHVSTDAYRDEIDYEPDFRFTVDSIRDAVQALPDGFRTVLTLYLFEGLDHAEIGQVLNISEQTSKSQYHRAKARLRERLTQAN